MPSMSFEVQKRLEAGDFGDEIEPGFHMADLGRAAPSPGSTVVAPPVSRTAPKTRAERQELAKSYADRLMQQFMDPAALNDNNVLNPIRDGIPQCSLHPFEVDDDTKIGCIHGCGNRERQGTQGVLPVAREGTVADVWRWVNALVELAITRHDKRAGIIGSA